MRGRWRKKVTETDPLQFGGWSSRAGSCLARSRLELNNDEHADALLYCSTIVLRIIDNRVHNNLSKVLIS